jgi:hypothetical protein
MDTLRSNFKDLAITAFPPLLQYVHSDSRVLVPSNLQKEEEKFDHEFQPRQFVPNLAMKKQQEEELMQLLDILVQREIDHQNELKHLSMQLKDTERIVRQLEDRLNIKHA